ncbi:hypothetical protein [Lysobacter capsici]|uniref:hypothetical protein n=1 Tax=Lysobacter capsici TaxID=435897 RepID=UPI001BFFF3BC|nr:hypothetical protein [Lysobacter capsici]QWF16290.1 hypothetical protein KME82_21445 [Lysobacter capsici]
MHERILSKSDGAPGRTCGGHSIAIGRVQRRDLDNEFQRQMRIGRHARQIEVERAVSHALIRRHQLALGRRQLADPVLWVAQFQADDVVALPRPQLGADDVAPWVAPTPKVRSNRPRWSRTMRGRIEQFAFIDGHQRPEERIHGTEEGFEHLRLEVHEASTAQ